MISGFLLQRIVFLIDVTDPVLKLILKATYSSQTVDSRVVLEISTFSFQQIVSSVDVDS